MSKKKLSGRRPIYFPEALKVEIRNTPLLKRRSQRKLASTVGISKTTVHRLLEKGILRVHVSSLKPFLTEENKFKRVLFALEWRNVNNLAVYQDMMDVVHLDEKWFYVTRDNERFILVDDDENPELEPHRTVTHKNHIRKVMFLAAMARPRFNHRTNSWFDGKVGIWPIGSFVPAQRKSKYHNKGDLVWRNQNVDREVYRNLLIEKLIPALVSKWPDSRTIRIQHDGARSHIPDDDAEFNLSLEEAGVDAVLYTQPANSPDMNILDLGFFRAVQSANDEVSQDEAQLIEHVEKAYAEFSREKINCNWLTLQSCLNEIIENHGNNDYKIPHMAKQRLERMGQLPISLEVTNQAMVVLGQQQQQQQPP
jgi:hypothetical protein